jgi:hypothetical protein
MMPAPSPVSGSAPQAARCESRFRISRPFSLHDVARFLALDVGDEADAAGVVLGGGVVEAVLGGSLVHRVKPSMERVTRRVSHWNNKMLGIS